MIEPAILFIDNWRGFRDSRLKKFVESESHACCFDAAGASTTSSLSVFSVRRQTKVKGKIPLDLLHMTTPLEASIDRD